MLRTEAGRPYGTAYHAHIKTTDGTLKVVLVNAVLRGDGRPGRPGPRRHGAHGDHRGGPGGGETALTGDTKDKVEAAVMAEYPGATIVRTETNAATRARRTSRTSRRAPARSSRST